MIRTFRIVELRGILWRCACWADLAPGLVAAPTTALPHFLQLAQLNAYRTINRGSDGRSNRLRGRTGLAADRCGRPHNAINGLTCKSRIFLETME